MTENQNTPTTELDFDEWLAGGERTTHHVTLFGRFDLLADIEELEKQRVTYTPPSEGDEALGGETDPNADIEAQIEALEAQLYASKREFRVSAITLDEHTEMKDQIRKDLKEEISAAALSGRIGAKETAGLLGVTAVNDINELTRVGANEKVSEVISSELRLRKIAFAAKVRFGNDWRPMTRDQVATMAKRLGDAQMNMLAEAALSASSDIPEVTIPKS